MSPDDYLTPPELAKIWRRHPSAVVSLIKSGKLKAFTLSPPGTRRPHWRIRKEAVGEFEKEQEQQQAPPAKQQARPVKAYTPRKNLIKFF